MIRWFGEIKAKIRRYKGWFMAAWLIAIVIALIAYGVNKRGSIEAGDVMQIMILLALVVVTGAYAWSASRQANASTIMANEMRRQTNTLKETVSLSVRPSISVSIVRMPKDHTYPFAPPREISFAIANGGKGPARNVTLACEGQGKKVKYTTIELPSLDVGDQKQFSISRATTANEEIRIAYVLLTATYNDEFGDLWRVTQQIDKNDNWKAGELRTERL